tara:strand:+ start:2974 stop:5289 length:2316 start_codon:yes stop_codon:yes gene_type:complete
MALKIYDEFAPFANVPDADYPNGSIKDDSTPGAEDGTPLSANWGNDYAGFDAALFAETGVTPTGDPDTALSSQRLDALKKLHINNLSLHYDFATRQLMIDSEISFPTGKRLYVKDIKASYIVTSSATTEPQGSPNLTGGGHARLQIIGCIHNITHYGAIDGAPDNTTAMQAAATQAGLLGGIYFIPVGLWIHGQIDMDSSTIMMGCGYESRDQRLSDPTNPVESQVGYRMFNSEINPAPFPVSDNIKNLTCFQIQFLGTVVADGFKEFKHLIMCQGVTNLYINKCWFTGFQGDGLVVRSGDFTAAAQNLNVIVTETVFDGVNNNNRNAISINDVYGMTIRDNKFENCTRNGSPTYINGDPYDIMDPNQGPPQPGAIDIEPNTADTYVILNDIYIGHNNCRNIRGNVAAIGMTMPIDSGDFDTHPPRNIIVEHNHMDGVNTGWRFSQVQNSFVTPALEPLNVKVMFNSVRNATVRPFWVFGVRGLTTMHNHYENCAEAGAIGWIAAEENCDNITMIRDTYRHCGTTTGNAISVYTGSNIKILSPTFDNIGASGGGFGVPINFASGVNKKIKIEDVITINNEGLTTGAISFSNTSAGSFTVGVSYKILTVGTTDFTLIGAISNTVGVTFVATGSGSGSGAASSYVEVGGNTAIRNDFAGFDASAFPADLTEFGETSFETDIVALSGGQGEAYQLTSAMNVCSGGVSFDSVKLPTATGNARIITISNTNAFSIQVYPFAGDSLGKGTNIPETLAQETSRSYKTFNNNNWIRITV